MRVLLQRSGDSFVSVSGEVVGKISSGLTLLIGFTEGDDEKMCDEMARKIVNLRIFPDSSGVMNLSLLDVGGEILAISQFTLYANTKKGNRPSYQSALHAKDAQVLYEKFCFALSKYVKVERGIFGADMEVSITNIGPTTILLER